MVRCSALTCFGNNNIRKRGNHSSFCSCMVKRTIVLRNLPPTLACFESTQIGKKGGGGLELLSLLQGNHARQWQGVKLLGLCAPIISFFKKGVEAPMLPWWCGRWWWGVSFSCTTCFRNENNELFFINGGAKASPLAAWQPQQWLELLCLHVLNSRKKKRVKIPLFLANISTLVVGSFALAFACLEN